MALVASGSYHVYNSIVIRVTMAKQVTETACNKNGSRNENKNKNKNTNKNKDKNKNKNNKSKNKNNNNNNNKSNSAQHHAFRQARLAAGPTLHQSPRLQSI